jgi:hypothetical protein
VLSLKEVAVPGKIFASLLLGSPRMKQQLVNRILEVEQTVQEASIGPDIQRQRFVLLKVLKSASCFVAVLLARCFPDRIQGSLLHLGRSNCRYGNLAP